MHPEGDGEVVVERAYVGRTHRPCGACGELVWVEEGCPHIPRTGPRVHSRHTRNARRIAADARERRRRDIAALMWTP